jgi:hypothetical protein
VLVVTDRDIQATKGVDEFGGCGICPGDVRIQDDGDVHRFQPPILRRLRTGPMQVFVGIRLPIAGKRSVRALAMQGTAWSKRLTWEPSSPGSVASLTGGEWTRFS